MAEILHEDVETRSTLDLRKVGAQVYAQHPTTDVWCVCYAFDDGPVRVWVPGEPVPPDVCEHVQAGKTVAAHNAAFERLINNLILGPRYRWPYMKIQQMDCTMARALSHGLPGGLGACALYLELPERKDDDGRALMLRMARPRPARKGEDPALLYWWDDEERLTQLIDYCKQDVVVERALDKVLPQLTEAERQVWEMDQLVNMRGMRIDRAAVTTALAVIEKQRVALHEEMRELTDGDVVSCTALPALKTWLAQKHDVHVYSLDKTALARLLEDPEVPEPARRALELRRQASLASVSKLQAMLERASPTDDRARQLFRYFGAHTGRFSSSGVQLHNLIRNPIDPKLLGLLAGAGGDA